MRGDVIVRGSLQRYGERGWTWETTEDRWHDAGTVVRAYRTNESGRGLWVETYSAYGGYEGWRQVRGTAQWALPASPSAARRAVRRELDAGE